jgi:hypothetical protein
VTCCWAVAPATLGTKPDASPGSAVVLQIVSQHPHTASHENKHRERENPSGQTPPSPCLQAPDPAIRVAPALLQWQSRSTSCKYAPPPRSISLATRVFLNLPVTNYIQQSRRCLVRFTSNRVSAELGCFESTGVLSCSETTRSHVPICLLSELLC